MALRYHGHLQSTDPPPATNPRTYDLESAGEILTDGSRRLSTVIPFEAYVAMKYPSELDLLHFFGVEPQEEDNVTKYTVTDSSGIELTFSFDSVEDSLQCALRVNSQFIVLLSHEGLTRLWIDEFSLNAEFSQSSHRVKVQIVVQPAITVTWSGLRVF